jgi:Holliday junction DNA helicase RuvB
VDGAGLDALDRRYLRALIDNYGGGPAGVETLAYALAEARDSVEDVVEPFLLQQGFIQRTPRGRLACARLRQGLAAPGPRGPGGPAADPAPAVRRRAVGVNSVSERAPAS